MGVRPSKISLKEKSLIIYQKGGISKRWGSQLNGEYIQFFSTPWVKKWDILGKRVWSSFFYLIPLFDITPFWSCAHPLINYKLHNRLLLLHKKLLSFSTFTNWWKKHLVNFCWYLRFILKTWLIISSSLVGELQ